jgi:hypothetical protein
MLFMIPYNDVVFLSLVSADHYVVENEQYVGGRTKISASVGIIMFFCISKIKWSIIV